MSRQSVIQGSIAMGRGSVLRIADGSDMVVHVGEGALWLTQEGDRRDRYLAQGDSFRLDRDGIAIAYAMHGSVIALTAPSQEPRATEVVLVRAGTQVPVQLYSAKAKGSLGERLRRLWLALFAPHSRPTSAAL
jgi:hypothetical protein